MDNGSILDKIKDVRHICEIIKEDNSFDTKIRQRALQADIALGHLLLSFYGEDDD